MTSERGLRSLPERLPEVLDAPALAELLGLQEKTLLSRKWRKRYGMPGFTFCGRLLVRREDFLDWITRGQDAEAEALGMSPARAPLARAQTSPPPRGTALRDPVEVKRAMESRRPRR